MTDEIGRTGQRRKGLKAIPRIIMGSVICIVSLLVAVLVQISRSAYVIPDCTADGTIAFVSHGNVFTINVDKTNLRQLTHLNFTPLDLAWSPDGTQILFSANQTSDEANIFVMNADGTNIRPITNYTYPYAAHDPTWSPNSKEIIFALDWISPENLQKWNSYMATRTLTPDVDRIGTPIPPPTNSDLFVMNADGTNQQNLTRGSNAEFSPHWSPDGKHVVFIVAQDDAGPQNTKPYIMNADGSGTHLLADVYATAPKWSPDGKYIVMARSVLIGNSWGSAISIINADGSGLRDLVRDLNQNFRHPAWSSNGDKIAFQVWNEDRPEINIIDFGGQHRCRLIEGDQAYTDFPSWKP